MTHAATQWLSHSLLAVAAFVVSACGVSGTGGGGGGYYVNGGGTGGVSVLGDLNGQWLSTNKSCTPISVQGSKIGMTCTDVDVDKYDDIAVQINMKTTLDATVNDKHVKYSYTTERATKYTAPGGATCSRTCTMTWSGEVDKSSGEQVSGPFKLLAGEWKGTLLLKEDCESTGVVPAPWGGGNLCEEGKPMLFPYALVVTVGGYNGKILATVDGLTDEIKFVTDGKLFDVEGHFQLKHQ